MALTPAETNYVKGLKTAGKSTQEITKLLSAYRTAKKNEQGQVGKPGFIGATMSSAMENQASIQAKSKLIRPTATEEGVNWLTSAPGQVVNIAKNLGGAAMGVATKTAELATTADYSHFVDKLNWAGPEGLPATVAKQTYDVFSTDKIGQFSKNVIGGSVAEAPKFVGGVMKAGSDAIAWNTDLLTEIATPFFLNYRNNVQERVQRGESVSDTEMRIANTKVGDIFRLTGNLSKGAGDAVDKAVTEFGRSSGAKKAGLGFETEKSVGGWVGRMATDIVMTWGLMSALKIGNAGIKTIPPKEVSMLEKLGLGTKSLGENKLPIIRGLLNWGTQRAPDLIEPLKDAVIQTSVMEAGRTGKITPGSLFVGAVYNLAMNGVVNSIKNAAYKAYAGNKGIPAEISIERTGNTTKNMILEYEGAVKRAIDRGWVGDNSRIMTSKMSNVIDDAATKNNTILQVRNDLPAAQIPQNDIRDGIFTASAIAVKDGKPTDGLYYLNNYLKIAAPKADGAKLIPVSKLITSYSAAGREDLAVFLQGLVESKIVKLTTKLPDGGTFQPTILVDLKQGANVTIKTQLGSQREVSFRSPAEIQYDVLFNTTLSPVLEKYLGPVWAANNRMMHDAYLLGSLSWAKEGRYLNALASNDPTKQGVRYTGGTETAYLKNELAKGLASPVTTLAAKRVGLQDLFIGWSKDPDVKGDTWESKYPSYINQGEGSGQALPFYGSETKK
jgi:hypothetical protein